MNAPDTQVERASRLDTATLSDAMDRLGIVGQCLGIKPVAHTFTLTGRAYTLRYGPFDVQNPGTVGDYIDEVPPGSVIVLDNAGRQDMTVWGDILTAVAHARGVAGTVIDGACRDVQLCRDLPYPVYSRSYSMRTGKDRVQVEAVNEVVSIGGVAVQPGDLLRGDADGVVALPKTREEEILTVAEAIQQAENQIRAAVDEGLSLTQARERHRYHQLQSRTDEGGET